MDNATSGSIPLEQTRLTSILTDFVLGTPAGKIPKAALENARYLILDTIGVSIACSTHSVGKVITDHVIAVNGKEKNASVFGKRKVRVSAPLAAMANGTLSNSLDYDGGGHIVTHLLPAVLAVAESKGLSGKDALAAFSVAYEASHKITKCIEAFRKEHRSPTHRGWWHVGFLAPITATMATCRLLKMNKKQTATAIGISTVSSAGVRRNMGTMSKGLHSGQGARFGIEAAWLAKRGFTGDPEILEAPLGLIFAISPEGERDVTAITERLAKPWNLEKSPGMKDFPAVTPGHGVIDASLAVRGAHDFKVEDIDYVESDYNTFSLLRSECHDDEEAGFCAPFMVASALVHNAFGLDQVTMKAVKNKKVQDLMKKVRQVPPQVKGGNRTTVHLKNGQSFSADAPRGRRVTDAASFEKKFMECATTAISKKAAAELMDLTLNFDKQKNIARIMALASGR